MSEAPIIESQPESDPHAVDLSDYANQLASEADAQDQNDEERRRQQEADQRMLADDETRARMERGELRHYEPGYEPRLARPMIDHTRDDGVLPHDPTSVRQYQAAQDRMGAMGEHDASDPDRRPDVAMTYVKRDGTRGRRRMLDEDSREQIQYPDVPVIPQLPLSSSEIRDEHVVAPMPTDPMGILARKHDPAVMNDRTASGEIYTDYTDPENPDRNLHVDLFADSLRPAAEGEDRRAPSLNELVQLESITADMGDDVAHDAVRREIATRLSLTVDRVDERIAMLKERSAVADELRAKAAAQRDAEEQAAEAEALDAGAEQFFDDHADVMDAHFDNEDARDERIRELAVIEERSRVAREEDARARAALEQEAMDENARIDAEREAARLAAQTPSIPLAGPETGSAAEQEARRAGVVGGFARHVRGLIPETPAGAEAPTTRRQQARRLGGRVASIVVGQPDLKARLRGDSTAAPAPAPVERPDGSVVPLRTIRTPREFIMRRPSPAEAERRRLAGNAESAWLRSFDDDDGWGDES